MKTWGLYWVVNRSGLIRPSREIKISLCLFVFPAQISESLHRKKSFSLFPSLAWMSLTTLSLGGNTDVIYKLFPPRESLVSDIPAGDGNIEKLFLQCAVWFGLWGTMSYLCSQEKPVPGIWGSRFQWPEKYSIRQVLYEDGQEIIAKLFCSHRWASFFTCKGRYECSAHL